ncbi:hypothetical protein HOE67_01740, partial [Candidatus Peregrinibacteria bacterium]|nr:hypothetical protein [Candidatus Peregrinibacteria bacterium]
KDKNLIKKANAIQKEIKKIMWEHAGIVRSHKKIQEGLMRMKQIKKSLAKIKPTTETTREVQEAINMLEVGTSILKSAKKRKKTLGCHFIA